MSKMSWVVESSLTYFQRICVNVLKCGPVPKHIAIILDGNRRFATKNNVNKTEGHIKGFEKLGEVLRWCLELGIVEVTVYAFSIENFKRSKEEVDTLMELATEKFKNLLEEKDRLSEEGICIRIIGNLSLLSGNLRKLLAEACLLTKDNKRAFLNVAFAYTSRDEITSTVNSVLQGVNKGDITLDDIDENLISHCLYTSESPDPDVIVRTSGEVRFSDYLLWQISNSYICFPKVLWPEFSIWHLLACVLKYQRCHNELKKNQNVKLSPNVQNFVDKLKEKRHIQLQSYLEFK